MKLEHLSHDIAEQVLDENPAVTDLAPDTLTPKETALATVSLIRAAGEDVRESPEAAHDMVEAAKEVNQVATSDVFDVDAFRRAAIVNKVTREYRARRDRAARFTGRVITRL